MPRAAIAIAIAASIAPASAEADCDLDHQLLGVPVWASSPNEGNTWGLMPIVMTVCPDDKRTHWLVAPSVSWNSLVQFSGTLRLFAYPDDDTEVSVVAGASTHINYRLIAVWQRRPVARWAWTSEVSVRVDRTVFTRFFGIGPDTAASDETSYTGVRAFGTGRVGLNVGRHINVGAIVDATNAHVEDTGAMGLPLAPEVFPGVPGMRAPSTIGAAGLAVRYDDRDGGDFAQRGSRVDAWAEVAGGVRGSPSFVRGAVQASTIVPELDRVTGAARVVWTGVSSSSVPFYAQSMLGGSDIMRGFTEGRFVDRMAWAVDVEQRIRLARSHFFGVVTDWRIDPFVAVGQVYGSWGEIVSRPRLSGGAGLRALVHPHVLGRVDLAYAGEGLKVYVEIGYPY